MYGRVPEAFMDKVFMCLELRGFSGSVGSTRSCQTFGIPFT